MSRGNKLSHLSPEEIMQVLKAAKEHSTRTWVMTLVSFRHGLRASEVCALKLTDVELKNGTIHIARKKGSLETTQAICGHVGQPLLDELKALRQYLRERPEDGSGYLFVSQKGGALTPVQWYKIFRGVAMRAGIDADRAHPHSLKHSLGYALVKANVNPMVIKQSLGHRAMSSTAVYCGVTDGDASAAIRVSLMSIF